MKHIVILRWNEIALDYNTFSLESDTRKIFGSSLITQANKI